MSINVDLCVLLFELQYYLGILALKTHSGCIPYNISKDSTRLKEPKPEIIQCSRDGICSFGECDVFFSSYVTISSEPTICLTTLQLMKFLFVVNDSGKC